MPRALACPAADMVSRSKRRMARFALSSSVERRCTYHSALALLASAFDRAALAIEAGARPEDCKAALKALIEGLAALGSSRVPPT
mgnify:FL=1